MDIQLTSKDKKQIEESIRGKYAKAASGAENLFSYPTGLAGLEAQNYDPELIKTLPKTAVTSYCGVGNPFTLGPIHHGEAVLDIGSGAGVDTLTAAMKVGPKGRAVGIDMTPEMLARARGNLRKMPLKNVTFKKATAVDLPFPDETFDVVISNGVFNLIINKATALEEVFRVLKPGGRLMMADEILTGELPPETKAIVESWAR
jgi:SAM-dependent methyltransferase